MALQSQYRVDHPAAGFPGGVDLDALTENVKAAQRRFPLLAGPWSVMRITFDDEASPYGYVHEVTWLPDIPGIL